MASSSSSYFSSGAGRAVGSTVGGSGGSGAGSGGVNRETLKGLQDVVWSDDEVSHVFLRLARVITVWTSCWAVLRGGTKAVEDYGGRAPC